MCLFSSRRRHNLVNQEILMTCPVQVNYCDPFCCIIRMWGGGWVYRVCRCVCRPETSPMHQAHDTRRDGRHSFTIVPTVTPVVGRSLAAKCDAALSPSLGQHSFFELASHSHVYKYTLLHLLLLFTLFPNVACLCGLGQGVPVLQRGQANASFVSSRT